MISKSKQLFVTIAEQEMKKFKKLFLVWESVQNTLPIPRVCTRITRTPDIDPKCRRQKRIQSWGQQEREVGARIPRIHQHSDTIERFSYPGYFFIGFQEVVDSVPQTSNGIKVAKQTHFGLHSGTW